ncbi:hypothetical protein N5K35_24490, partial [Pseudomonas sp. GD03651]
HSDYDTSSIEQNETDQSISTTEGNISIKQCFGGFELASYIGNPTILGITLSLTFWPNRNTPEIYAKIFTTTLND